MKIQLVLLLGLMLSSLWFTPDQLGWRHFQRGEFTEAAENFRDSSWRATALYRAGEFEAAAKEFARSDTAESIFNQGNAQLMHGAYEAAIACYDRALAKRPEWDEALENRAIAVARKELVDTTGGDMGDQTIGADKIVFDGKIKKSDGGQETEIAGGKAMSDQQIQALWLRRVQTKPADFLRNKFMYQQSQRGDTPQ